MLIQAIAKPKDNDITAKMQVLFIYLEYDRKSTIILFTLIYLSSCTSQKKKEEYKLVITIVDKHGDNPAFEKEMDTIYFDQKDDTMAFKRSLYSFSMRTYVMMDTYRDTFPEPVHFKLLDKNNNSIKAIDVGIDSFVYRHQYLIDLRGKKRVDLNKKVR